MLITPTTQAGPKQYTDADLALYDGTNPELPILLAINGTIYDVSAGRKFYGPGGSYSFFAGADASRAFVTNCFTEDRNPDLRGAEWAFIPRDDAEVDGLYKSGELVRCYITLHSLYAGCICLLACLVD